MDEIRDYWLEYFQSERNDDSWWGRKKALCRDRDAEIVRISGKGIKYEELCYSNQRGCKYLLHLSFLLKQQETFIREEQVVPFEFRMENGKLVHHQEISMPNAPQDTPVLTADSMRGLSDERFAYDRRAAVQYAERWWNSYNPAYRTFDVDCTNYVSQCLRAGGAPMRGAPDRGNGWWYQHNNWSYSWAVAHSLRWYLSGSTAGLKGKELESPSELIPGDVICYDFQGTGRFDHNTIVVGKDAYGMPLVNAHTDNSRNRYWSYEDSRAWTPDIEYKFFRIGE
ncbi:amidase domain-containing protein [Virgibacillus siamensis]|uniref:amidase domain-containing protein n=1 Tax=Virgibacillus siamensis TaxID=480071 RepID=UPI000986DD9D|nr:amidase domain-containing protein [Virgibacillus siamensis]